MGCFGTVAFATAALTEIKLKKTASVVVKIVLESKGQTQSA